ncbi:hypothetical protein O181_097520 [Austropuccinia psidii MF-1]|uniref:Integrase catalytic domain-containing protein n=1 Tax=Austropuccinia psidii MF-1 TaxID=1389203 RepID=A0A9Q3J7L8_9BASI|nr:hypothetical protein [Austropuccinia psidii MF-1]
MVFEVGPANSPQTNGIAEWFNQTLLTKFQFLLAQSNVPIKFWDEEVSFSSTLINILPSFCLNRKSPVSTLLDLKSTIEPVLSVNSLIPFGLNVFVCRQSDSKLLPPSKPFLYLGPEDYSDAGSLKKPIEGIPYTSVNSPSSVGSSQVVTIPTWPSRNLIPPLTPTIPGDLSPPTPGPLREPITATNIEHDNPILGSPSHIPLPQKKGYTYVPHYCNAPKDINSSISRDNIVTKSR